MPYRSIVHQKALQRFIDSCGLTAAVMVMLAMSIILIVCATGSGGMAWDAAKSIIFGLLFAGFFALAAFFVSVYRFMNS